MNKVKKKDFEGLPILCFFVAQVCINKSYCFRHNVVGYTVPIDIVYGLDLGLHAPLFVMLRYI